MVGPRPPDLVLPQDFVHFLAETVDSLGPGARRCLLERGFIAAPDQDQPTLRISQLREVWDALHTELGDTGIGLRLGAMLRLDTFPLFGEILEASATLGEACMRASRLAHLASDTLELSFYLEGRSYMVMHRPVLASSAHPESAELIASAILSLARQLAGRDLIPSEIHFTHDAPANLEHHRRILRAPVHFNRTHNACVFPSELLHQPVVRRNARPSAELDAAVRSALIAVPAQLSFADRVRSAIAAELNGGNPSLDHIAKTLGLHPKAVSRSLRAEGTSHRKLVDRMRIELADRYLIGGGYSVTEIALRVGYADVSSFRRAYRRKTGAAPTRYHVAKRATGTRNVRRRDPDA